MKATSESVEQELLSIKREQDKCECLMNFQVNRKQKHAMYSATKVNV
jgi:hypothetical protein